jgi:hypothetical protein
LKIIIQRKEQNMPQYMENRGQKLKRTKDALTKQHLDFIKSFDEIDSVDDTSNKDRVEIIFVEETSFEKQKEIVRKIDAHFCSIPKSPFEPL